MARDDVGRPKEYDRIKIGNDFVKWATDNPNALTVPMFAVSIGMHSGILRNWANENEEFRALYIEGKEQIGINRLRATLSNAEIKLDSSIYRAHVHNYDQDLKAEWREEKEFDSSLKEKQVAAGLSKEQMQTVSNWVDSEKTVKE